MKRDTISKMVHRTTDILPYAIPIGNFPVEDVQKLSVIEKGFAAKSTQSVLRGCVGALDGVIVQTYAIPKFFQTHISEYLSLQKQRRC